MATIDHVVVLALENRSFDHILGFLDHPDPDFDGLTSGGPYTNPGWQGAEPVEAKPEAKAVLPYGPDHSHDSAMEQLSVQGDGGGRRASNQGFVTSYERMGRGLAKTGFVGLFGPFVAWWINRQEAAKKPVEGRGPLAMLCQPPEQVPVLSTLALQFAVCTRWFCSVPGETWPNRNFLHAASSDGETNIDIRLFTNPTIFELLEEHGKTWRIYHDDTPQAWAFVNLWDRPERLANWFEFSEFEAHATSGDLPSYTFIEPNHRPPLHTLDHAPLVGDPDVSNSQHPGNNQVSNDKYDGFGTGQPTDFARAEALVASVYQALKANPEVFERTVLLITYDEHGGLYDHVPPPSGVPAPRVERNLARWVREHLYHRKSAPFDFTMLGPRVPAVVVSPYIKAGSVSTDVRDHASVPATLRAIFAPDAEALTKRDAWAPPFHTLLNLDQPRRDDLPDLSAHTGGLRTAATSTGLSSEAPQMPGYYNDFVNLAKKVRRKLRQQGVPGSSVPLLAPRPQKARQVSGAFAAKAKQARVPGTSAAPADRITT